MAVRGEDAFIRSQPSHHADSGAQEGGHGQWDGLGDPIDHHAGQHGEQDMGGRREGCNGYEVYTERGEGPEYERKQASRQAGARMGRVDGGVLHAEWW